MAIAVGETVGVGKRIRFMVRDKEGAKQDLQNHAMAYKRREFQVSRNCFTKFGRQIVAAVCTQQSHRTCTDKFIRFMRFMVRDKEGAKQDLQKHAMAYKSREFQVSHTS